MKITTSDIAEIVQGKLFGLNNLEAEELITDSRLLSYNEGQVFFAIKGKNHDGHQFILGLYNSGVRIFVAEEIPGDLTRFPGSSFIQVEDTIHALQLLAIFKRNTFKSTVIAITGSAGKTIVKEWLAEVLGQKIPVLRSPKSYNSQIGVPLSVWRLDPKYKLAIFEAGISQPGEMQKLRDIIQPDIGVITNIGDAHSENFSGNIQKTAEKLILFENVSTIIYCLDHLVIDKLLKSDTRFSQKKLVNWSFNDESASILVNRKENPDNSTTICLKYNGLVHEFRVPFTDRASVENSISVAVSCLALNTDPGLIRHGLSSLSSVAMRMELKAGINNCQLIEDYYNSDPGSLGMALESLKTGMHKNRTLILSDFIQSGREEKDLYKGVSELIARSGIEKFIGIGPALLRNRMFFGDSAEFFLNTDDFIKKFNPGSYQGETILLKGARKFEFEKIGRLLEQQNHQTVLEINLDAIANNLYEFRNKLQPGTRIMAMVKAFAYGAGPAETANLLEFHRVSYLGVAYADEGVELRNAGVSVPVMVMNPDPASFEVMIKYNLEPVIYSFFSLEKFLSVASKHGLFGYPVHIEIDTGMHRLGFLPCEIDVLCSRLENIDLLKIMSVFSHFAASEDSDFDSFTHRQAADLVKASEKIKHTIHYSFIRHICNSAGIVRFPEYQFEMVRPGIGIYGIGTDLNISLRPAGRFTSRISQVKVVKAGEPVGYGCADVSETDRDIAIIPVGYADGLNRKLGKRKGSFFLKGRRVPIVGNICMDSCMADVTGMNTLPGDEIEIFGENISIEEIADICETIPYEILTSIPPRVKRVFVRG